MRYGNSSEPMWWDNIDPGVAPMIVQVRTSITLAILAQMGQVRNLSASTQRVDVNELVSQYNQRLDNEVMEV